MNKDLFFTEKTQSLLWRCAILWLLFLLLYPPYLPMNDVPQHAMQVVLLDDLLKVRSVWNDLVWLNWDTPYLISYLLWWLWYQILPIDWASKFTIVSLFLLYLYALRQLRHAWHLTRSFEWIALFAFFGFVFQWGFVSFLLGVSVGILFWLSCTQFQAALNGQRAFIVLFWGVLSYYSHLLTFAFFCFVAYACFLVSDARKFSWQQRWFFTFPFLLLAGLLAHYFLFPDPIDWQQWPERSWTQMDFAYKMQGMFFLPFDQYRLYFYEVLLNAFILIPWALNYRLRRQMVFYLPFIAALLMYFIFPHFMYETAFLFQRFAWFLPMFYWFMWEKNPQTPQGKRLSLAQFAGLWWVLLLSSLLFKISYNHIRFAHSDAINDFEHIISIMQPEKRMLYVSNWEDTSTDLLTYRQELYHFGMWYAAQKHGWADYSFASAPSMIVRLRQNAIYPHYYHDRFIHLERDNLIDCQRFDYIMVRSREKIDDITQWLHSRPDCLSMKLIAQTPTAPNFILFAQQK